MLGDGKLLIRKLEVFPCCYQWSHSESNLKYFAVESELTLNTVSMQNASIFLFFCPSGLTEYESLSEIRSTEVTGSDK